MDFSKSYDAKFVFLEPRSYIHGSSMTHGLFEAVRRWSLGTVKRLQLNMRSILKEQGRYDLFYDANAKRSLEKEYNAMFCLKCGADDFFVGLKGRGEPVLVSEPYDEEQLITDCQILKDSKSATLILDSDKLIINIIIALNKKLVNTLFPSEQYFQWFLARYNLDWEKIRLTGPLVLEIEVVANIGASNTNSTIRLGGETIGSIYFSRKKK